MKLSKKTTLAAIGVAALGTSVVANVQASTFQLNEMSGGYEVQTLEGKCGEGKCGGSKAKKEGKCGEGKCGGDKDKKAKKEGKCGEGKCGGSKAKKEAKCGGAI